MPRSRRSRATRSGTTSGARSCPGWPSRAGSWRRPPATGIRCSRASPGGARTLEDRQAIYAALLVGRAAGGPAHQAADAPAGLDQRARGRRPGQELQGAPGGQPGQRPGGAGGDRRPAGAQRGGKDHDLLPYYGADPAGRRPGAARRARSHPGADVRAGPRRDRLSGAGALDLPEDDGRGEYSGDPRDAGSRARRAAPRSWTGCSTSCRSSTCAGAGPTA